jgi:Fur family peroxide stress response transcriptional regulator
MEFLQGNLSHPSAEEIYSALKERFPTLSFATVYNTLETLRDMGKVVEVSGDSSKKRFDPVLAAHHHLICLSCKKILDLPEKWRPVLNEDEKKGFQVIRSQIEFYGLCPQCRSPKS